jgi:hypothetical protein
MAGGPFYGLAFNTSGVLFAIAFGIGLDARVIHNPCHDGIQI